MLKNIANKAPMMIIRLMNTLSRRLVLVAAGGIILVLSSSTQVYAFPVAAPGTEGFTVVVTNGNPVIATFQGNQADYTNHLYLTSPYASGLLFNSQTSTPGSTVNLGSFPIGTELVFQLYITDTGESIYTGGSRARVQENWQPNESLVSFEDQASGTDYDDLSFSFTNTGSLDPDAAVDPTLRLIKTVVNNNGGVAVAANWYLQAAGPATIGGNGGAATTSVPAGTYRLTETGGPAGYEQTSVSCVGGADSATDGLLTLADDEVVTCTFVNNDIAPTLTLLKTVVNDDGGEALDIDWTLEADGPSLLSGMTGASSTVLAGTYILSETGPSGYLQSNLSCNSLTDTDPSDGLTLQPGENVSCTFTNDDVAPTLTLVSAVINDAGGTASLTDWTLEAVGPTTTISGSGGVAQTTVFAGNYDLSQSVVQGYALDSLVCTGTLIPLSGVQLTLAVGENAVCTFTHNDIAPLLTLEKEVVNDDGRKKVDTDWTLEAAGPVVISGVEGDISITSAMVHAGTYTLSEDGPVVYVQTLLVCTGALDTDLSDGLTLELAEVVSCVFTNNDKVQHIPVSSPLGLLFLVSLLGFIGRRYQMK